MVEALCSPTYEFVHGVFAFHLEAADAAMLIAGERAPRLTSHRAALTFRQPARRRAQQARTDEALTNCVHIRYV